MCFETHESDVITSGGFNVLHSQSHLEMRCKFSLSTVYACWHGQGPTGWCFRWFYQPFRIDFRHPIIPWMDSVFGPWKDVTGCVGPGAPQARLIWFAAISGQKRPWRAVRDGQKPQGLPHVQTPKSWIFAEHVYDIFFPKQKKSTHTTGLKWTISKP